MEFPNVRELELETLLREKDAQLAEVTVCRRRPQGARPIYGNHVSNIPPGRDNRPAAVPREAAGPIDCGARHIAPCPAVRAPAAHRRRGGRHSGRLDDHSHRRAHAAHPRPPGGERRAVRAAEAQRDWQVEGRGPRAAAGRRQA